MEVVERKIALVIILEKLKDLHEEVFARNPEVLLRLTTEVSAITIQNPIYLNGRKYRIEPELFKSVLTDLELKKIMKLYPIASSDNEESNFAVGNLNKNKVETELSFLSFSLEDHMSLDDIEEVYGKLKTESQSPVFAPASFDPATSMLMFRGKEILISRNKNNKQHYLLVKIFVDPTKPSSYDELIDDPAEDYNPNDWDKYYQAGKAINRKVAAKTLVEDFLIPTKFNVQINPKYFP